MAAFGNNKKLDEKMKRILLSVVAIAEILLLIGCFRSAMDLTESAGDSVTHNVNSVSFNMQYL